MAVHICTGNASKIREFERILGVSLTSNGVELDEVQSIDTAAVCYKKASEAYEKVGDVVIVDDTGLELKALGGFPGALVTWALAGGSTAILHRMLPPGADDGAEVITAIGYATSEGVNVFACRLAGRVIASPRGENGFGFDDVFVPDGQMRTLAEMSDAEKDAISPRALALRNLAVFLDQRAD